MIKIKTYKKHQLAQLYFPDVDRVTARQKLQTQIIARPVLRAALTSRERNQKANLPDGYLRFLGHFRQWDIIAHR